MPWWLAIPPLVGIALGFATFWVPVNPDEAWFLQVVQRCRLGGVLYRDTFYGAGPLPVWIALLAVRLSRPQALVLRSLDIAYFLTQLTAATWVLDQAGAPGPAVVALWAGSIAYSGPTWWASGHYTAAAATCTTIAAGGILQWHSSGGTIWLLMAGLAAGGIVAAKQNMVMATAALGVVVLAEGGLLSAGAFGLAAGAVVVACLAPVVWRGGFRCYVEQGFLNKRVYYRDGRVTLSDGFRSALPPPGSRPSFPVAGMVVSASAFLVLPVLAVAGIASLAVLLAPATDQSLTLQAGMALALTVVSLWSPFPRVDSPHVQFGVPVSLLAILLSAVTFHDRFDWEAPRLLVMPAVTALAVWMAAAVLVSLATRLRHALPADSVDRRVPYFRGVPVVGYPPAQSPAGATGLRQVTGGRVFLLRPDASLWYLAAGLVNPTPYDYPYSTVFGPTGQQQTIERIRSGDIGWVCSPGMPPGPLRPTALHHFVTESMEPVTQTAAGTLYRGRTVEPGSEVDDLHVELTAEPTGPAAPPA